jgi:hypothetical protein
MSRLHKIGSPVEEANYRPFHSHQCKVMEGLVRTAMIEHLENFGILSQHQHGFVRGQEKQT